MSLATSYLFRRRSATELLPQKILFVSFRQWYTGVSNRISRKTEGENQ